MGVGCLDLQTYQMDGRTRNTLVLGSPQGNKPTMKLSFRSYTSHYQPFHVSLRSHDDICARHFCFKENPKKTKPMSSLNSWSGCCHPRRPPGALAQLRGLACCVSHREPGRDERERERERERDTYRNSEEDTPLPLLCSDPPCPSHKPPQSSCDSRCSGLYCHEARGREREQET